MVDYVTLRQYRDFKIIADALTPGQLQMIEKICRAYERSRSKKNERELFHSVAVEWVEGCISTEDFIKEIRIIMPNF